MSDLKGPNLPNSGQVVEGSDSFLKLYFIFASLLTIASVASPTVANLNAIILLTGATWNDVDSVGGTIQAVTNHTSAIKSLNHQEAKYAQFAANFIWSTGVMPGLTAWGVASYIKSIITSSSSTVLPGVAVAASPALAAASFSFAGAMFICAGISAHGAYRAKKKTDSTYLLNDRVQSISKLNAIIEALQNLTHYNENSGEYSLTHKQRWSVIGHLKLYIKELELKLKKLDSNDAQLDEQKNGWNQELRVSKQALSNLRLKKRLNADHVDLITLKIKEKIDRMKKQADCLVHYCVNENHEVIDTLKNQSNDKYLLTLKQHSVVEKQLTLKIKEIEEQGDHMQKSDLLDFKAALTNLRHNTNMTQAQINLIQSLLKERVTMSQNGKIKISDHVNDIPQDVNLVNQDKAKMAELLLEKQELEYQSKKLDAVAWAFAGVGAVFVALSFLFPPVTFPLMITAAVCYAVSASIKAKQLNTKRVKRQNKKDVYKQHREDDPNAMLSDKQIEQKLVCQYFSWDENRAKEYMSTLSQNGIDCVVDLQCEAILALQKPKKERKNTRFTFSSLFKPSPSKIDDAFRQSCHALR